MIEEMKTSVQLSFWREVPECSASDVNAPEIESAFTRYQEMAFSQGLICERACAEGIVWGIDNMGGSRQAEWLYSCSSVFPTVDYGFEGVKLQVPQDWDLVLRSQYGDYLSLPKDINTHFEHVDHSKLKTREVAEALNSLIE